MTGNLPPELLRARARYAVVGKLIESTDPHQLFAVVAEWRLLDCIFYDISCSIAINSFSANVNCLDDIFGADKTPVAVFQLLRFTQLF